MDDLLISAPMYSPEVDSPEYGRVYVYRNDQVRLSDIYMRNTITYLVAIMFYNCICCT